MSADDAVPFWRRKSLQQMSSDEWESLCDGCGRCCVLKFEDERTGEIHPTSIACRLLDLETCRCTNYSRRHFLVPECQHLDAAKVRQYSYLPNSCAYRRLAEGRGLAWWHPLVSGDARTVAEAGISVGGNVVAEDAVHAEEPLEEHVVRWIHEP